MTTHPLPPTLRTLLVQRHFHEPFPPSGVDDLVAALDHVALEPGATLLRQGDPGNALYLVLDGRLSVHAEHADGTSTAVDEIGPGGVVGEMALLTGLARTATVRAMQRSDLARLARSDFECLAEHYPEALQEFLRRILPRLRRTQLIRVLTELFGELDEQALRELEARLQWLPLAGGATLFREGDRGDDVYIVVNGRLRVVTTDRDGQERVLEEVGRGAAVGELALLTGEPRAATIVAVRDSDLLRLSKAAFDELLLSQPRAMMQIARAAAMRLRRAASRSGQRFRATRSFALVPARPGVPLAEFARRLEATLGRHDTAVRLASADVDRLLARPGIAQSGDDSVIHDAIVAWLSSQERDHGYLILEADADWTPWTRRCLRQSDRVLVVARAGDDPAPGPIEAACDAAGTRARRELVLIHPDATALPAGTAAWLAPRQLDAHHHLRLGDNGDLRRVARRISGRATGLVLGGGGARGFVHIGMLRALGESGVEIDVVGGTSIGALFSAACAAGITVERMLSLAESFASRKKLLDRTLPLTSLMTGAKVTAIYRQLFGELRIEDLWIPMFAVSSDLSRAQAVVHRHGEVWRAIRASTAIPAIFPPILGDGNEVLVDGNVMNNMPLDIMRELCEDGQVLGVNPMPTADKLKPYVFGSSLSGWKALLGRLRWFGVRTRAPSILGIAMRATEINSANRMRQPSFRALADLLIEPPVSVYPILAFDETAPIIDIGYQTSREALAAWLSTGGHRA
ncbi:MAG: cyclic nucleotide-binding domain-containing protein [Betaproteobacteria bacterium]|nr:cyclic nucleotide-binding domain-containing protein [Betaproteobacteria bacterium]